MVLLKNYENMWIQSEGVAQKEVDRWCYRDTVKTWIQSERAAEKVN